MPPYMGVAMNTVGAPGPESCAFPASGSGPGKRINHRSTISRRRDGPNGWKAAGMQAGNVSVRRASARDAAACVAIYRPYVEDTAISWEIDVPAVTEMAARIAGLRDTHEWLVLQRDDRVIGFAYAQPLKRLPACSGRLRPASMSMPTITAPAAGGALHATAAPAHRSRLSAGDCRHHPTQRGQQRPSSILGFQDAGLYRRVVWKHGRWHDVAWMQLDLLATVRIETRRPARSSGAAVKKTVRARGTSRRDGFKVDSWTSSSTPSTPGPERNLRST